ncbi:hypothetical protein MFLAVUS_005913 [Mucor flavus]|uniref:Uncharacterized protein n=1 Tax=Mucor flavus TaxID=439312 RepID=A0ABP9Z009_9FUNG
MTTKRYEFQPPTNFDAIRSSIIQRIKSRSVNNDTSTSPLTPPPQSDEYDKKLPFLHLDNGLPSPPIETCCYEEDQLPTEMVVNALMELSPAVDSSQVIRERIRVLKEEKRKLFQAMKDLLSTPPSSAAASVAPSQPKEQPSPVTITTRPVARSRSISHTDNTTTSNGRPISRYYDRPRFYNNYPYQPSTISTPRRVINNNNSSYVSSRPQSTVRSSSSSFRPDRY